MKETSKGSLKCLLNTKAFRKTETPPWVLGMGLLKTKITWTLPPLTVEATGSHLRRGNEESGKQVRTVTMVTWLPWVLILIGKIDFRRPEILPRSLSFAFPSFEQC